MSEESRTIKQPSLGAEKLELLNGAPVFDPSELDEAIIDVYKLPSGEHVALYDYNAIVDYYTKTFSEDDEAPNDEDAHEQAVEWVDYNTVRSVPYMGARAPIILCKPFEGEDEIEEADPDAKVMVLDGKKWFVVECTHDLPEFHPHDLADTLVQA